MHQLEGIQAEQILESYSGFGFRIIETQEYAASLNLVETHAEQLLLEEILDTSKPPYRPDTEHLHYLLKTPFRYPPLNHGSRFASKTEPSLFYGSISLDTALSEFAYYRFLFLNDILANYEGTNRAEFAYFKFAISSKRSCNLSGGIFKQFQKELTSRTNYTFAQEMGHWLRSNDVDFWLYKSVRDLNEGLNIAISNPCSFSSNKPLERVEISCITTKAVVSVSIKERNQQPVIFNLDDFTIQGKLPTPAP